MYVAEDNFIELPDGYCGDPQSLPGPVTFAPAVGTPGAASASSFPLARQRRATDDVPFSCDYWPTRRRRGCGFGSAGHRSRGRPRTAPRTIVLTQKVRPGRRPHGNRFSGFAFADRIACIERQSGGRLPAHLAIFEAARAAREELMPLAARRARPPAAWIGVLAARCIALLAGHPTTAALLGRPESDDRIRGALVDAGRGYRPDRARDEAWFGQADVDRSRDVLERVALADPSRMHALHSRVCRRGGLRLDRGQLHAALSVAHVSAAKSVLRNRDASVPQCWIVDRLRACGFAGSGERLQRLASALLETLEDVGLLVCTDRRYAPRRARRFALAGASFKLPFVERCLERRRRRAEATAEVRAYERHLAVRRAAARIATAATRIAHSKSFTSVLPSPVHFSLFSPCDWAFVTTVAGLHATIGRAEREKSA